MYQIIIFPPTVSLPPSRSLSIRMWGVDLELDEGGAGDEEKEQEEFWVGERVKMLPPPTAHSEGSAWGSRRGSCGCVACGAGLLLWNVGLALVCVLVLVAVFALVLLPASLLLYAGFLCHSRVSSGPLIALLKVSNTNFDNNIILWLEFQFLMTAISWCLVRFHLRIEVTERLQSSQYRSQSPTPG